MSANADLDKEKNIEQKVCGNCKVGERLDLQKELYFVDIYTLPFYLCLECLTEQIKKENIEVEQVENQISSIETMLHKVEDKVADINQKLKEGTREESLEKSVLEVQEQQKKDAELDKDLEVMKENILNFEINESIYWQEVNQFEKRLQTLLSKKLIADNLEKICEQKLSKLNKFNTLNSLFKIEVTEQVALINSLKVGKKLNEDVIGSYLNSITLFLALQIVWDETNAGMGQVALLFVHLCNKFGYKMSLIKDIEISGNESCIFESNKNESLYLKGPFSNKVEEAKFNRAIKLLIDEFHQFSLFLENKALPPYVTNFELPYKIDNNNSTIDGQFLSTTITSSVLPYKGLDMFTVAFKKLLINFKYLISVNAIYDSKREMEILSKE